MNKRDLSPEARRCLCRCYSILLKLEEEGEEDTLKESELCEVYETARTKKTSKLTQLNNDSSKAEPEPVMRAE